MEYFFFFFGNSQLFVKLTTPLFNSAKISLVVYVK